MRNDLERLPCRVALFGIKLAQRRRHGDIGGNDEEISHTRRVLSQGGAPYSNSVSTIPKWAFIVACFALSPNSRPWRLIGKAA